MHFQLLEFYWFDSKPTLSIRVYPDPIFDQTIIGIHFGYFQLVFAIFFAHLHVWVFQLLLYKFLLLFFNKNITINGHLACDFLQYESSYFSDLLDILLILFASDVYFSIKTIFTSYFIIIPFISQYISTFIFHFLNYLFSELYLVQHITNIVLLLFQIFPIAGDELSDFLFLINVRFLDYFLVITCIPHPFQISIAFF